MKIKVNGVWEDFVLPVSIPTMTGASSSSNGAEGLVPQPYSADKDKFLKGDGSWNVPEVGVKTVSGQNDKLTINTNGAISTITINNVDTANKAVKDSDGNIITKTYPRTSVANTWTGSQYFGTSRFVVEKYKTEYVTGTKASPINSIACYTAEGAFTLDLSKMSQILAEGDSTIFSTFIIASADYTLRVTGVGLYKYLGDPTDLAITDTGLLLNIMLQKNDAGITIAIIQGTKLVSA